MRWELELLSWSGVSFGASHTYAALVPDIGERVTISGPLTATGAAAMNAADPEFAAVRPWVEGESTERFESREQATKVAIAMWRSLAAPGDTLVEPWTDRLIARCPKRG